MKPVALLLPLLLLSPIVAAAPVPPLLPVNVRIHDLAVAAATLREFDVEVPRTEKWLAWELSAVASGSVLSGTLSMSTVDGQPLRDIALDGLAQTGGLVGIPASAASRRVRISLRGGAQDMRADLSLLPTRPQLKSGQPVPVFARRRGSDAFSETLEMRLTKASDVDLRTWGRDANARLVVKGPLGNGGFPAAVCEDAGDAWRRCTLPALDPGLYYVSVEGSGPAVQLLASWSPTKGP